MAVRKFVEKTRHDYIRHVEAFARFLGRSPDTATAEDVRRFQVRLTESGVQPPALICPASALRFLFGITLDRVEHLARVYYARKLPRVLSGRLLEAAPGPGLKYKAALSMAYGAGFRAGEVKMLRVKRYRLQAHAGPPRAGQGQEGPACDALAAAARGAACLVARSQGWLFPSRDPLLPITARQLNRVCHMAAEAWAPGCRRTRCGTALPRTCWRTASTCA
jgi:integrase/recombinase XerD